MIDVLIHMLEIRDSRLYRAEYPTFEEYCRERWKLSRPKAYQLMAAAEVIENLKASTIVDTPQTEAQSVTTVTLPQTESQAHPLTRLEPPLQRAAWQEVVEAEVPITARVV